MRPLLLSLLLISQTVVARSQQQDCHALLQQYTFQASSKPPAPFTGSNLLFFLHVPRTAGKTFFSCLLNPGTPASRRCPVGYDSIHIDTQLPRCHLLTSHDDSSILQQLPPGTAVATQLRDPLDRVLSAYEFTVKAAVSQLQRQQEEWGAAVGHGVPLKHTAVTKEVWPWSHLTPWFAQHMKPKVDALKAKLEAPPGMWARQQEDESEEEAGGGRSVAYVNTHIGEVKAALSGGEQHLLLPDLDPYDNEAYMPLQEFIRQPIVNELLHNGELLQVLGLTNYSHWPQAAGLRSCMLQDEGTAGRLLDYGLQRLQAFAHVGTTQELAGSAEAAAAAINMPLDAPAYAAGQASGVDLRDAAMEEWRAAKQAEVERLEQTVAQLAESGDDPARLARTAARLEIARAQVMHMSGTTQPLPDNTPPEDETLDTPLGETFTQCAAGGKESGEARHKGVALPGYGRVKFNREARQKIPAAVIEEIRSLNSLDVRLYQQAVDMLHDKRQQLAAAGKLQLLPGSSNSVTSQQGSHLGLQHASGAKTEEL